jgi:hypothetical protein
LVADAVFLAFPLRRSPRCPVTWWFFTLPAHIHIQRILVLHCCVVIWWVTLTRLFGRSGGSNSVPVLHRTLVPGSDAATTVSPHTCPALPFAPVHLVVRFLWPVAGSLCLYSRFSSAGPSAGIRVTHHRYHCHYPLYLLLWYVWFFTIHYTGVLFTTALLVPPFCCRTLLRIRTGRWTGVILASV